MKKLSTTLKIMLLSSIVATNANAQTQLNESFNAPWSITSNGWVNVNNSIPIGNTTWTQGNTAIFPSASGPTNAYFGVLYLTASQATPATISNFLITPTISLSNGQTIQFATRTGVGSLFPDRLQLLMSTQGTSTFVGSGANSVGDFTDLLLDINPLYSLSTSSAVSNGTVNGYPDSWTIYTTTLTGITGTVTGRFAFRYFVTNAGLNATNGNYIGIDDVFYSAPCNQTTLSVVQSSSVTCTNSSVTFSATGSNTYSWSSQSGSITGNPYVYTAGNTSGNITFTVIGKTFTGCLSNPLTFTHQISACTGIASLEIDAPNQIVIFPNPNKGSFEFMSEFEGEAKVINSLGEIVYITIISEGSNNLNLYGGLRAGIYFIYLADKTFTKQNLGRFVVE